jgi:hypothetical protein
MPNKSLDRSGDGALRKLDRTGAAWMKSRRPVNSTVGALTLFLKIQISARLVAVRRSRGFVLINDVLGNNAALFALRPTPSGRAPTRR